MRLGKGVLDSPELKEACSGCRVVVITDENVSPLYGQALSKRLNAHLISIKPGEDSKSRETKQVIEDTLFRLGMNRDVVLIALGGGVVTDLVGFIGATYCRGVPVIYCPTSLLAMVDAAVGGKTGINTSFGKNVLGTFTEPKAVFMDTCTLDTLPEREFRGALAEVIKHGLVADSAYVDFVESHLDAILSRDQSILECVIRRSVELKQQIVRLDPNEVGRRVVLNAGHTVAHALEVRSGYTLLHGEAVAKGLVIECALSVFKGWLSETVFLRLVRLLHRVGFDLLVDASANALIESMRADKKNKESIPQFVGFCGIGEVKRVEQCYTADFDLALLSQALDIAKKAIGTLC